MQPQRPILATSISSTENGQSIRRSGEFVQTLVTEDFVHQALRQAGTLESGFTGGDVTDETAPRMTRSVEIQLSEQELAAAPEVTQVAVSGTVDAYGFVRNLTVTRSAGKAIDKKALAAVSEFRYKPATVGNQPVDAAVTVSIQIEKAVTRLPVERCARLLRSCSPNPESGSAVYS